MKTFSWQESSEIDGMVRVAVPVGHNRVEMEFDTVWNSLAWDSDPHKARQLASKLLEAADIAEQNAKETEG